MNNLMCPNGQRLGVITGRNEVVAKVMFLQVSVCPQGGSGCLPQCMLGCHPPKDQADTPPGTRQTPPGTRQTPLPPRSGLRVAGTHPTGMHSCLKRISSV